MTYSKYISNGFRVVVFEQVSEIPREPNGKFRAVVCNLPPEEKAQLGQEIINNPS